MNDLSHETLVKLMRFKPSLQETAIWFNVSEDTIERRVKKFERMTFSNFREKYSSNLRVKLQEKAIEMALNGNATMLIFSLKNICGWMDKVDINEQSPENFSLVYKDGKTTQNVKTLKLAYSPQDLAPK